MTVRVRRRLTPSYDVRGLAGKTLTPTYIIKDSSLVVVGQTLVAIYEVRQLAGADLVVTYRVMMVAAIGITSPERVRGIVVRAMERGIVSPERPQLRSNQRDRGLVTRGSRKGAT